MKSRCCNLKHSRYKDWGGKGITVCDRWLNSYENFEADMGLVPSPHHTLDRIDPNGNYEPANCRWATRSEQQRNRRDSQMLTFKDRTLSLYDWAEELGLSAALITNRLRRGWSTGRALSTPTQNQGRWKGREITYNGETKNITQWAVTTGVSYRAIWNRLKSGWPIEQVLGYKNHQ